MNKWNACIFWIWIKPCSMWLVVPSMVDSGSIVLKDGCKFTARKKIKEEIRKYIYSFLLFKKLKISYILENMLTTP
jgi:hypothetical protein